MPGQLFGESHLYTVAKVINFINKASEFLELHNKYNKL